MPGKKKTLNEKNSYLKMERMLKEQQEIKEMKQKLTANPSPKRNIIEEEDKDNSTEVDYYLNSTKDMKSIFDDFDEKYGKNLRHGGTLSFCSDEEADKFFREQASKGQAFEFHKAGEDKHAFSDGKGHYIMGTGAEVAAYKDDLRNGLLDKPNEDNSSNSQMSPFNMQPKPNPS